MNVVIKNLLNDVFGNDLEKFQKEMDSFFYDICKDTEVPSFILSSGNYPKVNISEKEKEYVIIAAVPGMKKEDLEITYKDSMLYIVGKSQNDKSDTGEKFICRELKKSAFNRSFKIDPSKIDVNSIKSSLENGELTITLSKKDSKSEDGVKININ